MRVEHLRVHRGRVRANVVTDSYIVPVELPAGHPAATGALDVLEAALTRAAVDAAGDRLAASKTRLVRARQRTARHLAAAAPSRRWA